MCVLLIQLKLKRSFIVKLMYKKKKNLHGNFVIMFSNASDISFTDLASGGVNGLLQEWYQSSSLAGPTDQPVCTRHNNNFSL